MRAMFKSQMDISFEKLCSNVSMLRSGKERYIKYLEIIKALEKIENENYISLPLLYAKLGIEPFVPISKKNLYTNYSSGIIVGAGSSEDCNDLIEKHEWLLIDLKDEGMENFAIGYENKPGIFAELNNSEGDTLGLVDEKYIKEIKEIQVKTLDSLIDSSKPGHAILSIDVEGLALDVLIGAKQLLTKSKPDLLIAIYHNWLEYLLIIPLLYDYGYNIDCIMCTNPLAQQPHLELHLKCEV